MEPFNDYHVMSLKVAHVMTYWGIQGSNYKLCPEMARWRNLIFFTRRALIKLVTLKPTGTYNFHDATR